MKFRQLLTHLSITCLTLALASTMTFVACGGEEEQGVPKVKNNSDLGTQNTGNNNSGDDNSNQEEEASACVQMCEKQISCLANICAAQNVGTVDQCAAQCEQSPPSDADYNNYMAATCDQINGAACTQADAQQACDCSAYASQGGGSDACDEGQTCFPTQQAGLNVCASASGTFPSDAPTCDGSTACPEGYSCMVESASAAGGSCLKNC